jgi:hypothetical protein
LAGNSGQAIGIGRAELIQLRARDCQARFPVLDSAASSFEYRLSRRFSSISLRHSVNASAGAYAEVYGRMHGPVGAVALVPHMLAAFIARDRGFKAFRSSERRRDTSRERQFPPVETEAT